MRPWRYCTRISFVLNCCEIGKHPDSCWSLSLETQLCWNWHDESHITELGMIINPHCSWTLTWMLVKVRTCIVKEKLLDTSFKQFGSGQVHSQWSSAFGCSCRQGDFLPKRDAVVFVDIFPGGASSCSQQPFRGRLADAALVLCLTFRCVSWEEVVDRGKPFATWRAAHGRMRRVKGYRRRENKIGVLTFWILRWLHYGSPLLSGYSFVVNSWSREFTEFTAFVVHVVLACFAFDVRYFVNCQGGAGHRPGQL